MRCDVSRTVCLLCAYSVLTACLLRTYLEEDVPREVRGQPQVELPVMQREGAPDREQVCTPQRMPLQLGQQGRERRL